MRSATRWPWGLLVFLAALLSPAALHAQTLAPVPALSFTKTLDSASNPLPQVFTVTSTGASFGISATATTSTGGNWLSVQSGGECCSNATPNTLIATANPSVNLAAGTYSGQIKVTQSSSPYASLTIPVTLTIEAATATYFDELPGGLTFTMQTSEAGPAPQTLPIRNAGTGTLNWTSSVSTSDGGAWLSLSAASGTAPSTPAVSINPANLPNGGRVAGTFAGQVLLKSAAGSVSVPVTVTVGSSVLSQVNPLSFTKTVFSASNPLAQQINLDDTGTSIGISVQSFNGTGGSWLSVQLAGDCCGYATPVPLTVTVAPNINLAVGTYTAEIVVTGGPEVEVIPVTLAVEPTTATYFDALPGELTFSMQTGGSAPPVQPLPIRNAGAGTLSWTASTSTSDRGNWLTLSATSGTAPSTPNVGINPANLPGGGLLAGTFSGQIVLQSGGDTVTIPVTVTVGAAVFRQINGLNFTKTVDSAGNPLSQVITIASTGANFGLYATAVEGTGGNWLSIQYGGSCCGYSTPQTLTVTANPATNLAAGTYSAEILIQAASGSGEAQVVPVTLTIEPASATFFDELPGQLTFSMQTGGAAPPSELVQIRNAGAGTLNFTAAESTADGGSWIVLSASSGAAPYLLSVSVNPAKLPGAGLVAGTFTGQVVLTTAGNTVTIPVTATVGDSVLRQLSPLNFSTRVNSTSTPMPQVITVASTDNNFGMYATAVEGTGGNWLSIQYGGGCCGYSTPQTLTVSVTPAVTLAAGTYTAEIIIQASNGSEPEVVPVTLTVEPVSAAYFDSLPGALTFSGQATGAAIASQPLNIRNAGPGLLNWMASTTTADGGKWLTLSSTSGVAPSSVTVSINPANLPNQGRVAGTYTGQILLQSVSDIVTIPVTVTLGDSVIKQPSALYFTMPYQGATPSTQPLTVASTDAVIGFYAAAITSTGGNWLSITNYNCCGPTTPYTYNIAANPASPLSPGVYTGAIYIIGNNGGEPSLVPVSLTVTTSAATATPTFSPGGGTYNTGQSVVISDASNDAAIYYTTDGTTPTIASTRYASPIAVTTTQTVKAIAIAPAYAQSGVASATYTITGAPATPAATETIAISEATTGATVYYTTNGSTPTSASAKYTGPITISASDVLKFIAIGTNGVSSAVRTVTITVQ